jgi:predicted transposase/invertase (TIGR01784 family)
MSKKLLSLKNDYVFRRIFGSVENTDILADFLSSALDLPEEELEKLTITDPNFKQEHANDKYGTLDVKVYTKSGKVIDVEIQIQPRKGFRQRIVFYTSRLISEQMTIGDKYDKIEKAVTIVIADFDIIKDSPYYHNRYCLYDKNSDTYFTDLIEIDTLELKKLPASGDGSKLWDWLKLISTEETKVMAELAKKNESIRKTVGVLKVLSGDERERELAFQRQKARWDEQALIDYARDEGRDEGKAEVARSMKADGADITFIAKHTGLTIAEIQDL